MTTHTIPLGGFTHVFLSDPDQARERRRPAKLKQIRSVETVIELLGGIDAIGKLTAANRKAIYHWRSINQFPANTYYCIATALNARGYTAPIRLWRMIKPDVSDEMVLIERLAATRSRIQ